MAQVSLWSHVGGLLTGFVVPLILWLMFKDRSAFAGEHAKEALNFQIVVAIALFVSSLLTIAFIGFVLIPAVFVIDIIFAVQGAMAGNRLQPYRYPWTFRFIK
ncbi:MAG: DUF4870 domain-containing protein [Cellulomonadaceae bacterium]|nr:DUF4870 domain-containing protein [Cellulomonadaceae bacterium]